MPNGKPQPHRPPGNLRERYVERASGLAADEVFRDTMYRAALKWDGDQVSRSKQADQPVRFRVRGWGGTPYGALAGWPAFDIADVLRNLGQASASHATDEHTGQDSRYRSFAVLATSPRAPREWARHPGCHHAYREWHAYVLDLCYRWFPPLAFPNYMAPTPADCPPAHPAAEFVSMCLLRGKGGKDIGDIKAMFDHEPLWAAVRLGHDGHIDASWRRASDAALATVFSALDNLVTSGELSLSTLRRLRRETSEAFGRVMAQAELDRQQLGTPSEVPVIPVHPGMTMRDVQAAARRHIGTQTNWGPVHPDLVPAVVGGSLLKIPRDDGALPLPRGHYPAQFGLRLASYEPAAQTPDGPEPDAALPERTALWLSAQGVSRGAIARHLGVPRRTVSRWLAQSRQQASSQK